MSDAKKRDGGHFVLVAEAVTVTRPGTTLSDATHIGAGVFAVADGIDDVDGSGTHTLFELIRLLDWPVSRQTMQASLRAANWSLWYRDHSQRGVAGVTVARWTRSRFVIGHLGDTRAYLVHGEELTLLTPSNGGDPSRDDDLMVTRLGQSPSGEAIEVLQVVPEPGDRLLLCTDGMWRASDAEQIRAALTHPPRKACEALESCALVGATEEASAVVVAVERDASI